MKKIKLEKCPHCGSEPTICSHGGVNCPNCMQFIRMLTPKEMKIHQEQVKEIIEKYEKTWKNRSRKIPPKSEDESKP